MSVCIATPPAAAPMMKRSAPAAEHPIAHSRVMLKLEIEKAHVTMSKMVLTIATAMRIATAA